MGNVVISPNIKKESSRIDRDGNIVDPKTKQVIQEVEREYVPPTTVESTPLQTLVTTEAPIQEQIDAAKKYLAMLEQKKLDEIAEIKRKLAELEA